MEEQAVPDPMTVALQRLGQRQDMVNELKKLLQGPETVTIRKKSKGAEITYAPRMARASNIVVPPEMVDAKAGDIKKYVKNRRDEIIRVDKIRYYASEISKSLETGFTFFAAPGNANLIPHIIRQL